jgi:uncharacterized protein YecE (DUF72 family)
VNRLRVGTSGYAYKEWKGRFYPAGLAQTKMLAYYAEHFDACEINGTFYRYPRAESLEKWIGQVPEHFTFVIKAPQAITHFKRLLNPEDTVPRLLEATEQGLGQQRGPLYLRIPDKMRRDLPRFEAFLAFIQDRVPGQQTAWEFRTAEWFHEDVYRLLRQYNGTLAISDMEELPPPPLVATAPLGYLRLRRCAYDDATLRTWHARIADLGFETTFVFFKHDDECTGPDLARRFRELTP